MGDPGVQASAWVTLGRHQLPYLQVLGGRSNQWFGGGDQTGVAMPQCSVAAPQSYCSLALWVGEPP